MNSGNGSLIPFGSSAHIVEEVNVISNHKMGYLVVYPFRNGIRRGILLPCMSLSCMTTKGVPACQYAIKEMAGP